MDLNINTLNKKDKIFQTLDIEAQLNDIIFILQKNIKKDLWFRLFDKNFFDRALNFKLPIFFI